MASKDRLKALVGEAEPESSGTISGTNDDLEGATDVAGSVATMKKP